RTTARPLLRDAPDAHEARPAEALATDPDAIAHRRAAGLHQIEKMLVAVDDDRARLLGRPELDDLALEGLRHFLVGGVVFARFLLVLVAPFSGLWIEDLCLRCKRQRRADRGQDDRNTHAKSHAAAGNRAFFAPWGDG